MKHAGRTTPKSMTIFCSVMGTGHTSQLLSGPGQVWLLKSPEGKGQKEKRGSSSYNRECDIAENENGWDLLDASS